MAYDGIFDISHWQNSPKLANAKAAGFDAVIMKGVGHYLMLEDPPRFGDRLEEALGRIDRSARR